MQLPNIVTKIHDPEKDVTYRVEAYRKLNRVELVDAVRSYHADPKSKKPRKGETVTIITIIGFDA